MLVSPVDSAWEILKGHILKASAGEPPDKTEKNLIMDICHEGGKNASTILRKHKYSEKLLVRLDEIVKKYDYEFNLAHVSGNEPITSAISEDGSSLWPASCETALFDATSKAATDHYRTMSKSSGEFTSDRQIMLLASHPDEEVGAMLADRIHELVEQNPDAYDDAKKDMMGRVEDHIADLDMSDESDKVVRARMYGHEGEDGYEDHIREVLHKQYRMRVMKNHYRDRAASEVIGKLQGVKRHHSTCPEQGVIGFPDCDCPSILESQRADFLTEQQRMGGRHGPRHWENEGLKDGVAQTINDLIFILVPYEGVSDSATVGTSGDGTRLSRIKHWWKNTPWDQRKVILGIQGEDNGVHTPMLVDCLKQWVNGKGDQDRIFHFIANFEGAKSKRRREGTGAKGRISTADPGIIGDWSSSDLYHYLNPDKSFATPDTDTDEDSLGDTTYEDVDVSGRDDSGYGGETHFGHEGEGDIEVEGDPYSEEDIVGSEYSPRTGSVKGGRKSRKTPFPIYTYRWATADKTEDEWIADMKERVKRSEGTGKETVTVRRGGKEEEVPKLDTTHPDYMSRADMKDTVGRHKFAAQCIGNLNKANARDILKEKKDHLQQEIDDRKHAYSSESRKSNISPKTMELALELLGFLGTKEGMRYAKLNKALYIDGKFKKDNPAHVLDSPVGRGAINNLLQGSEKHREAAGQTVRTKPCPKCNGSRFSSRRSSGKGGRQELCKRCPDPITGEYGTGVVTAYREVDASPEQQEEVVRALQREHDAIKANFIPQIRELADKADFTKDCQGCDGSGKDDFLRDEQGKPLQCLECDGYGKDIFLDSFLNDIVEKQELGLDADEAADAAIKAAERRHSVLKYRDRDRLHNKRMSDIEKHAILSNGIPAMFHMNKLHVRGGLFDRRTLEGHRKEELEENPDMGFHSLKRALGDRLLKRFKYQDRNHDYHGLRMADAVHSPYFDELLNILSERPHLGEATSVTSAKLKRHLREINSPQRFEHRPPFRVCPSCEGTKKEQDHHTHEFIEGSSCTRCSVRGKRPTGFIKERGTHNVSRIFDLPEIRTGVPHCPCCKDGVSQMVNSPGGLGKSTRIYHFPIDFDFDSMTRMDFIFTLEKNLQRAQKQFREEPNPSNKQKVFQIWDALNDAIEEESPLLTKALKMSFEQAQAETGKTGRSMEAFIGGEKEGEEYRDYGVSFLERPSHLGPKDKWEPTAKKTPCPFCAEASKRNEPLPDKLAGTKPMLGDKDGYHGPGGFLEAAKGCPSDAHREDGTTIFRQMLEVKTFYKKKKMMSDELEHQDMLDLIQDSWSKGPVIDDLRDKYKSVSKATPQEKRAWFDKNPGKTLVDFFREKNEKQRDRQVYSPRAPQTIGDYKFSRFAALRRRHGKPTPQERIDHESASGYLSSGRAKASPVSNLAKTDYLGGRLSSEPFTKGERFLDKLDSSGVLDNEDGVFNNEHELRRLFAIHVLIPDYYGHRHCNPLYLTGGESEQDLQKWARRVLKLKKNHPVGEEMKTEFRHNLHMIEPMLQLEKEWSHYYLAPRQEMIEDSGWPASIFNTTDSKQPFLNQDDLQRVFGELRGHYRDWQELMRYGHYSPDHHGFLPPTVHFPDLCLFLNNPDMPKEVAEAWFAHDDEQLTKAGAPEWMHTKGKKMEEMQELASVLWAAGQGDQNTDLEYPPSVEWMDEDRADGNEPDESTKMLWFRIRDMLQRRSRDPEGSRKALDALMVTRNRTQLNSWGFPTACPGCKGEGQVTAQDFLEHSPAFIDMVHDDGYFSDVPLDRDGKPLEKVDGEYQMNDPKVHQFFRDHARSFSHPNWVDHKEYDKDDPHWRRHVMMQCPGCKGTHVCPSCDGHTGRHHPHSVMMAVHNVRNMLHKEAMKYWGKFMRQPVMEDGPVEMQVDNRAAMINMMPAETLGDYLPSGGVTRAQIPPYAHTMPEVGYIQFPEHPGKEPPAEYQRQAQVEEGGSGLLWVEEKDDEGKATGHYYTLRDPWFSNSGGKGSLASFDRELKRVTADELFGGLSAQEFYDREDKRDAASARHDELKDWAKRLERDTFRSKREKAEYEEGKRREKEIYAETSERGVLGTGLGQDLEGPRARDRRTGKILDDPFAGRWETLRPKKPLSPSHRRLLADPRKPHIYERDEEGRFPWEEGYDKKTVPIPSSKEQREEAEKANLKDKTLAPSKCVFPGCSQKITHGQKYCTGEEEYPHITYGAHGRKFMDMRPVPGIDQKGRPAPNHHALVQSPHYKDVVLNSAMPSKNYWGGRQPLEKMLEQGFRMEGSKRFGVRNDLDTEAHKEFVKSDFARVLAELGVNAPKLSETSHIGITPTPNTPHPHMVRLRGRNRMYHRLVRELEDGEITQKEFDIARQTRDEQIPAKGEHPNMPYVGKDGKPLPGLQLTKVPWALNDTELEDKIEEMQDEWFNVTREAVAAWRDSIEKIDMHIPYFTHPEHPGRVFTPFDIFGSEGVPEDHLHPMFDYIPHGLDPDNNVNHQTSWREDDGTRVGVYSVMPKITCKTCWSELGKEERKAGECDTCGATIADEDDMDTSMMKLPFNQMVIQSSGSPLPPGSHNPFVNTAKHPDLSLSLHLRKRLRDRAAYIAESMDTDAGEFDPALIRCNHCDGWGNSQNTVGDMVKCGHCVQIPDFEPELGKQNHVTFNDFDKDAIIQIHSPNYRIMVGNPQDPDSWKPIDEGDEEEFKKAVDALRLGAGGSKVAGRLLASEAEKALQFQQKEVKGLTEVEDEDRADKAEHYLRTFLQIDHDGKHSPVKIPTMNSGILSNNAWNNEKGGSPLAKFRGHHNARDKVEKEVNKHFDSANHDLLVRELFRLTGARYFSDLGTKGAGGGQMLPDGTRPYPSWKPNARAKKLAKGNMKTIRRLQKKKSLSEIDQETLNDALTLKVFLGSGKRPAWKEGLGNPIALAQQMESKTTGYMLAPKEGSSGIDRDIEETVSRGAFLGGAHGTSADKAVSMLSGILDHNDNRYWHEKGIGKFGTAGMEYAQALGNIISRAESAFYLGGPVPGSWESEDRGGDIDDPKAHIRESRIVRNEKNAGQFRSQGALMKNALFTPSGLHDEAHKAYGEGRDEHGDQYMGVLGDVFQGTGIDAPRVNDKEIEMGKTPPHSSISPQDMGQTLPVPTRAPGPDTAQSPGAEQAKDWGAGDESLMLSDDEPMVIAWDTILKNLAIIR